MITDEALVSEVARALCENHAENWKRWKDYTDGLHLFLEAHKMKCRANTPEPLRRSYLAYQKGLAGLSSICLVKRQASLRGMATINISKPLFSSGRYRLMVYYLPSTAGQVGQAETSLPICSAAFNWPYFGERLHHSKHFHIWWWRQFLFVWLAKRAAIRKKRLFNKKRRRVYF